MAEVRLKDVNKVYRGKRPVEKAWWAFWKSGQADNDVHVVQDATLQIADGEFVVLVGPSGCGKSTTLRMIAGLEEVTSGDVFIGDRRVNEVSPKDRDIAMVFQNYALYPHMNVRDNMAFGLRFRNFACEEIERRVQDAARLLDIEHLLARKPKELSGGQRQRVAMGRAIVRRPQVYLMDEPLSNLDAKLRVQMRAELAKLHRQLGVTTIYVTHDQTEAMTLGERIVLMKDGAIQQVDTPLHLYEKPANRFVAGFIGSPAMNFLSVRVEKSGESLELVNPAFRCLVPEERRQVLAPMGGKPAVLGIRPQDLHEPEYARTGAPLARIRAQVDVLEPLGSEIFLYGSIGQETFIARADAHSRVKVGEEVELVFDLRRFHLFDAETEEALVHPVPVKPGTEERS
ncbi:MAG: sn-glycerol-3-phosphate ABC transporter ATP-binding protein UgpC [Armatimonadetes bacterium]|nr:sn-glycerol-3-phosphate ABC transporter ATP-binding protein UgpC [Armatimonadota bacterium]